MFAKSLCLKYPLVKGTFMLETRRARRFDCNETLDCEIRGQVKMAYLRDVSLMGGRIQGADLPEVGSLIRVTPTFSEYGLEERFGRQWVYAQVCWVSRGEVQEAGIRFMEPRLRLRHSWVADLCEHDAERRTSIRVATEVHLEIKVAGVRRTMEATSLDLSQGGAQALLPGVIRPGTQAEVTLCLPWAIVDVPATVVRQASLENSHHSLRFLKMPRTEAEVLNSFLHQQLVTQKASQAPNLDLLAMFNNRR